MSAIKVKALKRDGDSVVLLTVSKHRGESDQPPLFISSKSGSNVVELYPDTVGLRRISYRIELGQRGNAASIYRGGYDFYIGQNRIPLQSGRLIGKSITSSGYQYLFHRTKKGLLHLKVKAVWGSDEMTKEQRDANAIEAYARFRDLPLEEDKVFFESMSIRAFNDNPRAIYQELAKRGGFKLVWGLSNEKTDIGSEGVAVRYRSLAYWKHLATAKYIVSNMNQFQLVKRPGQIVIQTMHGIPLKHMGLIVTKTPWKTARMKKLFSDDWDYFVTPCDYMSDIIRGPSYRFTHNIIESGYPRNDELINHANDLVVKGKVRSALGVPENKKVILWAPTWRTKKRFDVSLDLKMLKKAYGKQYVVVLRAHYLEQAYVPSDIYNDFVLNGHTYENVNDMLVAADVLITDYSSIMFDYSLLNRPFILYMWDYDSYIKRKRGTYFDPKEEYPELVARSTEEVIKKLEHPDTLMDAVNDFHKRFNQYETGHAAKTVVDTIWGEKEACP